MDKVIPLKKSFSLSLIFHAFIFLALIISFAFTPAPKPDIALNLKQSDKILQAVSVNQTQVEQEVAKLKNQQQEQAAAQQAKLKALQQQAAAAAKLKQQQEQQLAQIKAQQQAAIKQQQDQLTKLQQQQQQAQKQLTTIQQNTQKAKAQQQKQAAQKQLQQSAEKSLQQQLAQDATQLDAQKNQQINDEIAKYAALIKQAISQKWIIPANSNRNAFCILDITLSADGTVNNVKLSQSSGDTALDQSAITAVYKASPLPVPTEPNVFKRMQEIQLKVQPQAIG